MHRHHVLVSAVVMTGSLCLSQHLPLHHYGIDEGLVSNDVLALLQDSRGYLWIGTGEGVSRYDGRSFTKYRTTEGLPSNYITCIAESRKFPGVMWFGSWGKGLSRFQNGKFETISDESDGLANIAILVEDSKGDLWCGTATSTLVFSNGTRRRLCVDDSDIPAPYIIQPNPGEVWLGTDRAIHVVSLPDYQIRTVTLRSLGLGPISCMLPGSDGTIWLGTQDGSIARLKDMAVVSRRNLGYGAIRQILDDGDGNLWLCTGKGLLLAPAGEGSVHRFTTEHGLAGNNVGPAIFDHEGNLWFSSSRNGLSKWSSRATYAFPMTQFPHDFPLPVLSSGVTDNQGHLWLCAGDGMWEIWKDANGEWTRHRHTTSGVRSDLPATIVRDKLGRLWTWTVDGNTECYVVQSGSPSRLSRVRRLRKGVDYGPEINGLHLIDSRMRFWYLTGDEGIVLYDHGFNLLGRFTTADGLPSNDIRAICEDHEGNIWLGGVTGGIALLSDLPGNRGGFRVQLLGENNGLIDQGIRSLAVDRAGRILIGTRFGGLIVYNGGKFSVISIDDGLISNGVYSLAGGTDSTWWVGTGSGLQSVDAYAFEPAKPLRELTGQMVYACGVTEKGYVWSLQSGPEDNTLIIHEPARANMNRVPPPVHITELYVNSVLFEDSLDMEFPYDQNTFTIGFAGLSFRDERSTRFQHRLVGGGGGWSPLVDERSVTYSGLAPGDYLFEVRAFNNDGVPSAAPASVAFSIAPPFWNTWWFYLISAAAVFALFWSFYRYRVSSILALERVRFRIARDLHDDVGGTLSGITHMAEAAASDREGNGNRELLLRRIAESTSEVQASLDDIVWSLNPAVDSWDALVAKCRRYTSDLCEAKGIRHELEMNATHGDAPPPLPVRENFWLLYKEIIINAVKHSGATLISVRFSVQDPALELVVRDNGIGFDGAAQNGRHGLKNLRLRAEALGAETELVTSPGEGTQWTIRIRR